MEFCEGELFEYINDTHTKSAYHQFTKSQASLNQVPMKRPNKWIKRAANMFKQICNAVQWLHSKGYCHLDLSLENTMIADKKSVQIKVIDLGLARKLDHKGWRYNKRVGKLQYMSPEVFACGNRLFYDARKADVYCMHYVAVYAHTNIINYVICRLRCDAIYDVDGSSAISGTATTGGYI